MLEHIPTGIVITLVFVILVLSIRIKGLVDSREYLIQRKKVLENENAILKKPVYDWRWERTKRQMKAGLHNHLARKIPNTIENVGNVRLINILMKQSKSKYRLKIKYRGDRTGPDKSHVRKENSQWFSVYIYQTDPK